MILTDTLNGNYLPLYGEVVDYDIYEVRTVADSVSVNDPTYVHWKGHSGINFVPDTVLDLGANIGIFSRYARSLWPDALIVAVEPNEENQKVFKEFTSDPRIILIEGAIGAGMIYRCHGAVNGAHECYLSKGLGYNELAFKELSTAGIITTSPTNPVMLTDLRKYIKGRTVLKIDIEGNETVIFNDPASVEMMKEMDYICAELHYFAANGGEVFEQVKKKTHEALNSLSGTHSIRFNHVYFYARKYN